MKRMLSLKQKQKKTIFGPSRLDATRNKTFSFIEQLRFCWVHIFLSLNKLGDIYSFECQAQL